MFNNYYELYDGYKEFYQSGNVMLKDSRISELKCSLNSTRSSRCLIVNEQQQATVVDDLPHQTDSNGHSIIVGSFNEIHFNDYAYILLAFVGLTIAKRFLVAKLRQSTHLNKLDLRQKDRERLEESLWRLVYYTISSTWLIYSCFIKHQSLSFFNPNIIFDEYSFDLDWDEYVICIIECAFYLHGTYALLFEDVWRRDSPMMLLHHVAASFSFIALMATRIHRIGLAAVVLRDTCDVLLEVTKVAMCFRIQRGKLIKSTELPIKCCFSIFTACFIVNQLYYYPLFCLYHMLNVTNIHGLQTPTITGILTCCLIFLLLDLFWSIFIVRLLYRMLFTSGSVDDLREYDADEILEMQSAKRESEQIKKLL